MFYHIYFYSVLQVKTLKEARNDTQYHLTVFVKHQQIHKNYSAETPGVYFLRK